MLNEINQRKTNIVWYPLHVESKKYNKLEADSDMENRQVGVQHRGRGVDVQTVGRKIGIRMSCTTKGM